MGTIAQNKQERDVATRKRRKTRGESHHTHCTIEATVFAEVPPRVEYTLTQTGASLGPIVTAMGVWGKAYERREREGSPAK